MGIGVVPNKTHPQRQFQKSWWLDRQEEDAAGDACRKRLLRGTEGAAKVSHSAATGTLQQEEEIRKTCHVLWQDGEAVAGSTCFYSFL